MIARLCDLPGMRRFQLRPDRRPRWGVAAAVLAIHVVLVAGLIRAFTPDLAASAVRAVTRAFTLEIEPPPPPPPPSVAPSARPATVPAAARSEGAAAAPGRKASPRDVASPEAPIVIVPTQAPPVVGQGEQNASGARDSGNGSGAGGAGNGKGAGSGGSGAGGGGAAAPTVKIAGEINSAKDYPRASRSLRIGASVVIDLRVGTGGQVNDCKIVQPSPDSQADRITCDLAIRRFRFRPALSPRGVPVEAIYRWRQRWYY